MIPHRLFLPFGVEHWGRYITVIACGALCIFQLSPGQCLRYDNSGPTHQLQSCSEVRDFRLRTMCVSVTALFFVLQWTAPLIGRTFNPGFHSNFLGRGIASQTFGKYATILGHLILEPTHYLQSCSKGWTLLACDMRQCW